MPDWTEISRCFSALRPAEWIDPKVSAFLRSLEADRTLLIACSGGADSVFLSLAMRALFPDDPQRLVIAHFNHQLRGAESDGDQAFVEEMAAGLGLRCLAGRPKAPLESDEALLREARYGWLGEAYESERAAGLAVGHHADDLLESLLMGVLTGSGPSGLASPMPVRRFSDGQVRLRPLLGLTRERIHRTLRSLGVPWREDRSNADPAHTRNWLRLEIIPRLAGRIPQDLHVAAQRTRELQEECLEALDASILRLGIDFSDPDFLDTSSLKKEPAGLVRRAFMAWWMRWHAADLLPKAVVDQVLGVIQSGREGEAVTLPGEAVAPPRYLRMGTGNRLSLESPPVPLSWPAGCHWSGESGPLFLPDGSSLRLQVVPLGPEDTRYRRADPRREAWLEGVAGPLYIRQWQAGDRYQPLGAPGRRKLQDIFSDAKLKAEQKHRLPVIVDDNGDILWVPGFPPAHRFRICHFAKSALQLTYSTHSSAFRLNHGG